MLFTSGVGTVITTGSEVTLGLTTYGTSSALLTALGPASLTVGIVGGIIYYKYKKRSQ